MWLGKLTVLDMTLLGCLGRKTSTQTNLLNYKAYNHQTLHSASPQCTDSAGSLTRWPWPIFHAPLPFTPFTSPFYVLNYKAFSHQTLYSPLSRCTDLAGTLTWWPWPIYCTPVPLTHFMLMFDISSNIRPITTKHCIVLHLIALAWQVPWPVFDKFYVDVR